ncbi:MAG: SUMF1/EgtB/PvdO family nonheme iron enzyme [Chitinispirillales bacterium]|nr:SUMF1/EgtB/PvdO family nonheme iron enzyme [Chitinispirillales bacterium]
MKTVKIGVLLTATAALFSTVAAQGAPADYTEALSGLSGSAKTLDMVYVRGGTYQRGCSAGDNACEETEKPAHSVTLSDFYIGKYEVTNAQWKAVMGDNTASDNKPKTNIIWYDAVAFTCRLSQRTGKKYRLATDAEFEYASRGGAQSRGYLYSGGNTANDVAWTSANSNSGIKDVGGKAPNELGIYDMSGNAYELTYDSWGLYGSGGAALTNPIDRPTLYSTKVRRGGSYSQPASKGRVSARERRSIKGKDGSIGFRLAMSVSDADPAAQVNPCDIHEPLPWGGVAGFRDERLITADDEVWADDSAGYMLVIKANGAAAVGGPGGPISGEWYTLNCFSLRIVSTGSSKTTVAYPYYMITPDFITLIGDKGPGGPFGRFTRKRISEVSNPPAAPVIANPTPLSELAGANINIHIMSNPPENEHDPRLIEGTASAWVQDNVALNLGGTHRYRKDFDSESSMRFLVWDNPTGSNGTSTLLATGPWFTVNNTFLRVKDPNRAVYDYLYAVSADGKTLYHITYQSYELGDFRTFAKISAGSVPQWKEPTSNTTFNQGASTYIPPTESPTSVRPVIGGAAAVNTLSVIGRTLRVNAPVGSKTVVRIVNLTGKTVANLTVSGAANLSLQKIPSGAYLIEARIDGRVQTRSAVLR